MKGEEEGFAVTSVFSSQLVERRHKDVLDVTTFGSVATRWKSITTNAATSTHLKRNIQPCSGSAFDNF